MDPDLTHPEPRPTNGGSYAARRGPDDSEESDDVDGFDPADTGDTGAGVGGVGGAGMPPATAPASPTPPDAPESGEPAPPERMLVLGGTTPPTPPAEVTGPSGPSCEECPDGRYDDDGYCATCGAKARDPRDHFERQPASWVAGVCDRGIRHAANEDALAVAASDAAPRRASMIVCDGVSTAQRSAEASQAAADSALSVLDSARSRGIGGTPSALAAALGNRLDVAADAAADAVHDVTELLGDVVDDGFHVSNPACTFVAAVIDGDAAVIGSVGDSRAYWVPDAGDARRLTTDDSWAEEQIKLGASRAAAEVGPQAHTITRWIGVDTPDHVPAKTTLTLHEAGWLVLCSDGLWNYCSEEDVFAGVVRNAVESGGDSPARVAQELVAWANAQGGRDNITVALARIDPAQHRADAAESTVPTVQVIPEESGGGGIEPPHGSSSTHTPNGSGRTARNTDTGPGGIDG